MESPDFFRPWAKMDNKCKDTETLNQFSNKSLGTDTTSTTTKMEINVQEEEEAEEDEEDLDVDKEKSSSNRIRGSSLSAETLSSRSSCSNSCSNSEENAGLDGFRSFVFGEHRLEDNALPSVTRIGDEFTLDNSRVYEEITVERSAFDRFHRQMDYFRKLALYRENEQLQPINGTNVGFYCALSRAPSMVPMIQGFPHDYYRASMEDAVEQIHRQDAAAKQIKKLRPKKFRCEYCNVAFSNNGQLKGHVRIHTGERPFKCDAEGCDKSFTRNEELTRHRRIHTGLRPHACVVCGKRFGRKDHLKKHTKTHENRDSYHQVPASTVLSFQIALERTLPSSLHPITPYFYNTE